MIFDKIKNASQYYGININVKKALEYLAKTNFDNMEPGRYEIDGNTVYALVQQYETRNRDQGKWEAHKKYIDVQYVANGVERMGYANSQEMELSVGYNEEKDIMFFEGNGEFLIMKREEFIILFPNEVHMPGQEVKKSDFVKKVVVKVLVD